MAGSGGVYSFRRGLEHESYKGIRGLEGYGVSREGHGGGGGGGPVAQCFVPMLHESVALSRNIFGTAALLTASIMSD